MTAAGALLACGAILGAVIALTSAARIGWEVGGEIWAWITALDPDPEPERCKSEYMSYRCGLEAGHEGDHRSHGEGSLTNPHRVWRNQPPLER